MKRHHNRTVPPSLDEGNEESGHKAKTTSVTLAFELSHGWTSTGGKNAFLDLKRDIEGRSPKQFRVQRLAPAPGRERIQIIGPADSTIVEAVDQLWRWGPVRQIDPSG